MSDAFSFAAGKFASEGPRSAAFSDAADRLGRVASIVKDQQLAAHPVRRAPAGERSLSSPAPKKPGRGNT